MITGIFIVIASGLTIATVLATVHLHRTVRTLHHRARISVPSMLEELPSVSVCIPVRNEEHAMTHCLEDVLASRYPKLEVLVYDDSSKDETPSLIKAFARDGVRFIEGVKLEDGWLGKNAALNTLLSSATGSYVIFLDVDTRIKPDTIGQLVAYAQQTKATMVSALPVRVHAWRASTLFAPLRYFWKLLQHTAARPIAASSMWLIDRKAFIADYDDFSALKSATEPEMVLAAVFAKKDAYRFLISYELLGIRYEKKLSSQIETGVRVRFPAYGFSMLRSLAVAVLLLVYLAIPLGLLLGGGTWYAWLAAVACIVSGYVLYWRYLSVVWREGSVIAALLYPFVVLLDSVIILQSAWSYTRKQVTWKGRNISR